MSPLVKHSQYIFRHLDFLQLHFMVICDVADDVILLSWECSNFTSLIFYLSLNLDDRFLSLSKVLGLSSYSSVLSEGSAMFRSEKDVFASECLFFLLEVISFSLLSAVSKLWSSSLGVRYSFMSGLLGTNWGIVTPVDVSLSTACYYYSVVLTTSGVSYCKSSIVPLES